MIVNLSIQISTAIEVDEFCCDVQDEIEILSTALKVALSQPVSLGAQAIEFPPMSIKVETIGESDCSS